MTFNRHLFSSQKLDWATPLHLYNRLNEEFEFTVDACASYLNTKHDRYWHGTDGLEEHWLGERVFLNPPYGRVIGYWMEKCYKERLSAVCIVALIPSRTDTHWWHEYVMSANQIRFIRGRIKFGNHDTGAPFPSALAIWDNRPEVA